MGWHGFRSSSMNEARTRSPCERRAPQALAGDAFELEIRETHRFCANDNNKITEKEWWAIAHHSKNPII